MNLTTYENFLNEKKALRSLLETKASKLTTDIQKSARSCKNFEEAQDVMNAVAVLVQHEFEEVIEELVTRALKFVFGDNHSFEIESTIQRNQPEIHMFIVKDGERYSPRDEEVSGGQADVVSFALRVVLWAIQYERTRPTLIFDEPFKFVGSGPLPRIREMIEYLSKMLNLQFIIITHEEGLAEAGDTCFNVVMEKGVSRVEVSQKSEY